MKGSGRRTAGQISIIIQNGGGRKEEDAAIQPAVAFNPHNLIFGLPQSRLPKLDPHLRCTAWRHRPFAAARVADVPIKYLGKSTQEKGEINKNGWKGIMKWMRNLLDYLIIYYWLLNRPSIPII
jgi:hypothetical protein